MNRSSIYPILKVRCGIQPANIDPTKYTSAGALVVLLLTACSSVSPSSLKVPSEALQFKVEATTEWLYREESFRPIDYHGRLAPGTYVARHEDSQGTYYVGPGKCFSFEAVRVSSKDQEIALGKEFEVPCGVYLPKDTAKDARIFTFIGSPPTIKGADQLAPIPSGNSSAVQDVAMGAVMAQPSLGPAQAGLATGLSVAVVGGLVAAEKGNISLMPGLIPRPIADAMIQSRTRLR
jgi:hypothetical protein